MNKVELYINDQYIDLDLTSSLGSSVFAFTMTWDDLSNPSLVKDDYTKTLTIPGTPNNNTVFSDIWRFDSEFTSTSFNPSKKADFRLMLNSSVWKTGVVKLNTITIKDKVPNYAVTLYGKVTDFITLMNNSDINDPANRLLSSLPFPKKLTHQINHKFIQHCWDITSDTAWFTEYAQYFRCNNGTYENFDSASWYKCNVGPQEIYSGLEFDELSMNELRSYYQRVGINIQSMFNLMKSSTSTYKIDYDITWFNDENPYYASTYMLCKQYATSETTRSSVAELKQDWSLPVTLVKNSNSTLGYKNSFLFKYDKSDITNETTIICSASGSGQVPLTLEYQARVRFVFDGTPDTHSNLHFSFAPSQTPSVIFQPKLQTIEDQGAYGDLKYCSAFTLNFDGNSNVEFRPEFKDIHKNGVGKYEMTLHYYNLKRLYPTYKTSDYTWIPIKHSVTMDSPYVYTRFLGVIDAVGQIYGYTLSQWSGLVSTGTAYTGHFEIDIRPMTKTPTELGTDPSEYYPADYGFTGHGVTMTYQKVIRSNSTVNINDMLDSDITQGKFLLDYCKLFGLVISVDNDNNVKIQRKNTFFKDAEIIDWTYKVDWSKDITITPLTFDKKYIRLGLKSNSTYYEKSYTDHFGSDFGSVRLNTGYDFNTDVLDMFKDNMFTNTIVSRDKAQLIKVNGKNETYREPKVTVCPPLAAYYSKGSDNARESTGSRYQLVYPEVGTSKVYLTDDVPTSEDATPCWVLPDQKVQDTYYGYNYSACTNWLAATNVSHGGTYNLTFGKPQQVYDAQESNYSADTTIYSYFWKNYLNEIYNVNNHKLSCYVLLTPADILNFSFKNFVTINNVLYHPNKIDNYNPLGDGLTKVELIKVRDINNYKNADTLVIE